MLRQIPSKKPGKGLFIFSLITLFIWSVLLQACNPNTTTGGISTSSADSYKLSKKGEDSLKMRQQIWQEADDFCSQKDQYFMPIAKNYTQNFYEMEFRCLNAGDPELLEGKTPFQEKRYNKKLGGYGELQY